MKSIFDTPSNDDAYTYQVPINYLEQIRIYGRDEEVYLGIKQLHMRMHRETETIT